MTHQSHVKQLHSLDHQFLVAMPNLDGGYFEKAVIYIVEDNETGTMGINLTQPMPTMNIETLLSHFKYEIKGQYDYLADPVFAGGPVDVERGFVLHRPIDDWQSSMTLSDRLAMTVSEDLLKGLAEGQGPQDFIVALGYSGWKPNQLNAELQSNSWLTLPYNEALLFEVPAERKWQVALSTLGVTPEFLSMEAGHA